MVWHYHDDEVTGPEAAVDLAIRGWPISKAEFRLTHYRVDEMHGNAFMVWQNKMGSNTAPNVAQYAELLPASQLTKLPDSPAITTLRTAWRG